MNGESNKRDMSSTKFATSNCIDAGLQGFGQPEWMPWSGSNVCPKCGSHEIEYNTRLVLTSYPAQSQLRCRTCGHIFSSGINVDYTNADSLDEMWKHDQSILNIPKVGDWPPSPSPCDPLPYESCQPITTPNEGAKGITSNYGWICPRCGKVNAPHKDSCDCNINIINYGTDTGGEYINPNTTITISKEGNLQ
jgi:rubredoxin